MYIWERSGLGEETLRAPTRVTLAMRPKPYLRLDCFDFDQISLTVRLISLITNFADAIVQSWNSARPITVIRLVGHTDSTGQETYNVGLGNRRARAVEKALQDKLKGLSGRVQIVRDPSPGETEPTADNRTREGQARNRRVEVFITTGVATPPPTIPKKPPINLWDWSKLRPPQDPIIQTKPEPYWQPMPPGRKGQSVQDWLDEKLRRVPSWLRTRMRDAIVKGSCATLATLMEQAGLTGAEKQALESMCEAAVKTPSR